MPSKRRALIELDGKKCWRIRDYEVDAETLKDALLSEVCPGECLAWKLIEPDRDEEFEFQRQESLDNDEELTEAQIWDRVYETGEWLWMDLLSDLNRAKDPNGKEVLEAVSLTWDDVEVLETECQHTNCDEMIATDDPRRCRRCGSADCDYHRRDYCSYCGHEWNAVDFLRMAVNT